MNPAERVTILRRIAKYLSEESWTDIDLHLQEFGFETLNSWNGSSYDYALALLRAGGDESLVRLDAFLFGQDPQPDDTQLQWRPGQARLFISHISAHKDMASELSRSLNFQGLHGFVAHEDIAPNREWAQVIVNSLRTCDALVALLHPGFHESVWTDQEVGFVLGRGMPVLSVRLGADPYGFMGMTQGMAGLGKPSLTLAEEIAGVLADDRRTKEPMRDAFVTRLEQSQNFYTSNLMTRYLSKLPLISREQYDRLRAAQATNDQVTKANEVPAYLDSVQKALGPSPRTLDPIYGDEEPF